MTVDLKRHRIFGKKMIGYLEREYPKGKVLEEFLRKLKQVEQKERVIASGGFHACEYCQKAQSSTEYSSGDYIWPDMLAHYIKAHQYLPPQEFIDFIMNS